MFKSHHLIRRGTVRCLYLLGMIITCIEISSTQTINYQQYHPFDSTGVLKEKMTIAFGHPKGHLNITKDTITLQKIDIIANLLDQHSDWVLVINVYDNYHLNRFPLSFNPVYASSSNVARHILYKPIEPSRIDFRYPGFNLNRMVEHEELFAEKARIELLLYQLNI